MENYNNDVKKDDVRWFRCDYDDTFWTLDELRNQWETALNETDRAQFGTFDEWLECATDMGGDFREIDAATAAAEINEKYREADEEVVRLYRENADLKSRLTSAEVELDKLRELCDAIKAVI